MSASDTDHVLGYCPHCGAKGKTREKRPNGNDECENGHTYPSKDAAKSTPKFSAGFEAAVKRAKRRRKYAPYHFPGARD